MQFNATLDIKKTDIILKNHGLGDMGEIQKFVDSESIRRMAPYTPFAGGELEMSATLGTVVGSGLIQQIAAHARVNYYGKLMVSSETGSAYASKGEKKVLTDIDLKFNKSNHPLAGPFWFERMKADDKDEILKGAQRIAEGKKS